MNRAIADPKFRRRLKGDIDTIVLKALRKEPERRYASVEQFAEDIRRHLEGLPVSAVPDSFLYRCNKFVRRHKLPLAAVSILAIAVLLGVLATLYQARKAAANELRAEKRFAEVRRLANSMLFEIHDSIQDLPGSIPARKLLVERALQYLDSLSQESNSDPSLQRELASAYKRVGDVQGYPYLSNLGDVKGALESYRKAQQIEASLVQKDPANISDALDLATIYRRLSELDSVNHDLNGALAEGKQAVAIGERLSAEHPTDNKVLEGLVKDYQTLAGIVGGNASANLGDTGAALDLHKKVVEIAERLAASDPANASRQRLLASGVLRLGDQFLEAGYRSDAEKQYLRGEEIVRALATPNNVVRQTDLADAYVRVGTVRLAGGNLEAARSDLVNALEIYKSLSAADPRDTSLGLDLSSTYATLGDDEFKLGARKESSAALEAALSTADDLASRSSTSEMRSNQGLVRMIIAETLDQQGNITAALQHFFKALEIYSNLAKDDPSNVDTQLSLAAAYNKIGATLLHDHKIGKSEEAFHTAKSLVEAQKNPSDSNAQLLYLAADTYTGLGDVMLSHALDGAGSRASQVKNWQAALSWYEESLSAWRKVPEPGIESPAGFDCVPPEAVTRRANQCRRALKQLGANVAASAAKDLGHS